MSQGEKSLYYKALKERGVPFDRHYRDYTTAELKAAYTHLTGSAELPQEQPKPQPAAAPWQPYEEPGQPQSEQRTRDAMPPRRDTPSPLEFAGQRQSKPPEEVIRIDDKGRHWLQEEVLKPATAKPRGRRVLTYNDPGAVTVEVKNGEFTESFEVAGDRTQVSEVKVTLPSFQVGIFRVQHLPFKIFTYRNNECYDLLEVEQYFGGPESVPETAKRKYVLNVLGYDIRSVNNAIREEERRLMLAGRL